MFLKFIINTHLVLITYLVTTKDNVELTNIKINNQFVIIYHIFTFTLLMERGALLNLISPQLKIKLYKANRLTNNLIHRCKKNY